jgi:hypothetical protein
VFFPQTHRPGAETRVDFGEVAINLHGEPVTCMLSAFRLSFSGKAVHKILRQVGRRHSRKATSTRSPRSWDTVDEARRIGSRAHTVGELFAIEQPLPDEPFETDLWLSPRVDRYSQVTVRTNRYSAPPRLVGRPVRVHLHASHLVVYDGRVEVARHERLMAKSGTRLDLDHYLEALLRKPGALPGSTALEQARAAGKFTPVHDAWWKAVRKAPTATPPAPAT